MAGYGHSSATGIDERTLGRIDLLLFDADYADAAAAVEDARRVAVLVADPHLRTGHERARLDAVVAANLRRDPGARALRPTVTSHRMALVLAFVLAAVAAALVLSSRGGLTLQAALLRRNAPAFVADAFIATRLAQKNWGCVTGALDARRVDVQALLERAYPG